MNKIITLMALLLTAISFSQVNAQTSRRDRGDFPVDVGELRFFESDGYNVTHKDDRIYTTTFKKDETRYIYYELSIKPKATGQSATVSIENVFYHPSGSVFCSDKMPIVVNDTVTSTYDGCAPKGGVWSSGTYTVVLMVNGKKVARETFTVED